jgi:hypothetical protein
MANAATSDPRGEAVGTDTTESSGGVVRLQDATALATYTSP